MRARVRILPSGSEFTIENRETVLEAGLRSGLSLHYRCTNGSCGECKAKVVSGKARDARFHDFSLTEMEKAAGQVLLCCTEADSDLVIEVREIGGVEEVPYQEVRARVSKMERVRDDMLVLRLRTPRSQALEFLSGQYVSLTLPGLLPRYRSIASCPCNGTLLEFHIRRIPGDAFSEYAFTRLRNAQPIVVSGPEGRLSFDKASTRPVIFFAYDTGFAPIKSLVEYAISLEGEQPMALYWMTLSAGQHYLDNLCRAWADALDNFSYFALTSIADAGETDGQWSELSAVQRVVEDQGDLSDHDVYIAGPQALVFAAGKVFMERGLPPERFFADSLKYF